MRLTQLTPVSRYGRHHRTAIKIGQGEFTEFELGFMFSFDEEVCLERVAMPLTNNRSRYVIVRLTQNRSGYVVVRLTNNRSRYVIVRLTFFRTVLATFPLQRIRLTATPCSSVARIWQHLRLTIRLLYECRL